MQSIKRKASHVLVCGKSGTGKTSYAERYIIGSHHDRIFIFDHQSEFQERLALFPVFTFEDMQERLRTERILCFDYTKHYFGHLEETYEAFCDWCFYTSKDYLQPLGKESLMMTDEIQKTMTTASLPQPLKNILQTGRRFNLDTLSTSQQPNELHNSLRNQVTEFVCYRLQDQRALKWVCEAGIDIDVVSKLPDLSYLWKNMQTGEERIAIIDYPEKPVTKTGDNTS